MKHLRNFKTGEEAEIFLDNFNREYNVLLTCDEYPGEPKIIKSEHVVFPDNLPAADEILFIYTNSEPLSVVSNKSVGKDINGNSVYAVEINEEKSDDTNIFVKLSGDLSRIEWFEPAIPNWKLADEIWFGPGVVSCQATALWDISRERVHTTNPNADIERGWVMM